CEPGGRGRKGGNLLGRLALQLRCVVGELRVRDDARCDSAAAQRDEERNEGDDERRARAWNVPKHDSSPPVSGGVCRTIRPRVSKAAQDSLKTRTFLTSFFVRLYTRGIASHAMVAQALMPSAAAAEPVTNELHAAVAALLANARAGNGGALVLERGRAD